jgi:XTP/dITP diphosphohydrolase
VLASRNEHKVLEVRRILAGSNLELVGLDEFPEVADVVESGVTFEANALLKAQAVSAATGLPALADDSGLTVEVMGGMPGIFSARWCGRHGDDPANLELLLRQLHDVPAGHRSAAFVCAAAFVSAAPETRQQVVRGELTGRLIKEPRGTNGFGYDPIFVPDGHSQTTAEMSAGDKDAISHRGRAFRAMADYLAGAEGGTRTPTP